MPLDLDHARSLDEADPLARFRERFLISDPDMCYLDGNSLGRLPKATIEAVRTLVVDEWGGELVTGWSHWIDMAQTVGDRIGTVVLGARAGQVLATDTTSVNLYRLALAAIKDRPGRSTIVVDEANFPTDRYILQGIAADLGMRLVTIPNEDPNVAEFERITPEILAGYVDDDVALVCLQIVNYRSGARQEVSALTEEVRSRGAYLLWDASHAVGVLDLQFDAWGVDLAVGCTYKYCNAGPGAPGWLFIADDLQPRLATPIDGWFGQRDQFAMGPTFHRAESIRGFQTGTPPIIGLTAIESSIAIIEEAGIASIESKAAAGTEFMLELFEEWLAPLGFDLATPRPAAHRGGHVSLGHPEAEHMSVALRELANVVPDFRRPNIIRVAVSPLYTSYLEIFDGFARLRDLVASGHHRTVSSKPGSVT